VLDQVDHLEILPHQLDDFLGAGAIVRLEGVDIAEIVFSDDFVPTLAHPRFSR